MFPEEVQATAVGFYSALGVRVDELTYVGGELVIGHFVGDTIKTN